jgi:hypothetical protein
VPLWFISVRLQHDNTLEPATTRAINDVLSVSLCLLWFNAVRDVAL